MYRVKTRLKELMDERGVKQGELAEALGVSPGTISRWARNQVDLYDRKLLEKFLNYFDCDLSDILVREYVEK